MKDRRKPIQNFHAMKELPPEEAAEVLSGLPVLEDNELEREVDDKLEELERWFGDRGLHYAVSVIGNKKNREGPAIMLGAKYVTDTGIAIATSLLKTIATPGGRYRNDARKALAFVELVFGRVSADARRHVLKGLFGDPQFRSNYEKAAGPEGSAIMKLFDAILGRPPEPEHNAPEEETDGPRSTE